MSTRQPYDRLYKTARWEKRARMQMQLQPLCKFCSDRGVVTAAKIADHIIPHRGDYKLFWFGELQSLCSPCHSGRKAQLEHKGYVSDIGSDGFPTDEKHPFNQQG